MKFAPKKLLSLMLAVVMAASLATPALATEPSEPADPTEPSEPEATEPSDKAELDNVPQTGDTGIVMVLSAVLLIAFTGILVCVKAKKENI